MRKSFYHILLLGALTLGTTSLVMTIWKSIITIFCPKISCTGMRQI